MAAKRNITLLGQEVSGKVSWITNKYPLVATIVVKMGDYRDSRDRYYEGKVCFLDQILNITTDESLTVVVARINEAADNFVASLKKLLE